MKQKQENFEKCKNDIINDIISAMESEGEFIYNSKTLSSSEKLVKVDVVLDVIHYLKDYDRNNRILNKYNSDHRFDAREERV